MGECVWERKRESNERTEGEREKSGKRVITLICDSLVECIRACWQTEAAGRYEELGGTAASE